MKARILPLPLIFPVRIKPRSHTSITVNLLNLINPAQEAKVEAALYKLAQENSTITMVGLVVVTVGVMVGLGDTLNQTRLAIWVALMMSATVGALLAHRILKPLISDAAPSASHLRRWRRVHGYAFTIEGFAWGSISLLFDASQSATLNTLFLLIYLSVMSAGGRAAGSHSFRLYLFIVACSMLVMLPNLSNGFGAQAFPLGLLVVFYAIFVAKVSYAAQQTLMHSIELQFQNEQLLKEKAALAQLAERERIYRDLHDDVGAKLLGLAISAQRANLPREADMARAALQDLRDVVSRTATTQTRLDYLLADWRVETQQRLDEAGMTLTWQLPTTEQSHPVNTAAALNISRLLRESVSNVLRHARASHLTIGLTCHEHKLVFTIQDDGVGLKDSATLGNRGMNSMRARASALGGFIQWETLTPRGCRVTFEVARSHLMFETGVAPLAV